MAKRAIYIPKRDVIGVEVKKIDFQYFSGFSILQKQKSIKSLRLAAENQGFHNLLDISSKSDVPLGVSLSAFNLKFETVKLKQIITVENAFQSSKVLVQS